MKTDFFQLLRIWRTRSLVHVIGLESLLEKKKISIKSNGCFCLASALGKDLCPNSRVPVKYPISDQMFRYLTWPGKIMSPWLKSPQQPRVSSSQPMWTGTGQFTSTQPVCWVGMLTSTVRLSRVHLNRSPGTTSHQITATCWVWCSSTPVMD